MILKFESYFEKPDVESIRDILNIARKTFVKKNL